MWAWISEQFFAPFWMWCQCWNQLDLYCFRNWEDHWGTQAELSKYYYWIPSCWFNLLCYAAYLGYLLCPRMTQFLHYHPDYKFLPRWRRSAALVFYPRVPISVRYTCRPDQELSCERDLFERRGLNIENTIRTITKSASCDFCTMAVSCTCTCGRASYALIAWFILDIIIVCSSHFS